MAHKNATPRPWFVWVNERDECEITTVERIECSYGPIATVKTGFIGPAGEQDDYNAALIVEAVNAYDTLRAENEKLREELACTLEELIDHTGDDLIDSRQARVNQLRSDAGSLAQAHPKRSPIVEALHDLLSRPTDPAARQRARAALSDAAQ